MTFLSRPICTNQQVKQFFKQTLLGELQGGYVHSSFLIVLIRMKRISQAIFIFFFFSGIIIIIKIKDSFIIGVFVGFSKMMVDDDDECQLVVEWVWLILIVVGTNSHKKQQLQCVFMGKVFLLDNKLIRLSQGITQSEKYLIAQIIVMLELFVMEGLLCQWRLGASLLDSTFP
eukprot:TRINITY_DN24777_c0_g1_i7.p2 TRINITY_DN24777_c0_g1~~TRINITY_DN24777_c0_g1_i7.p2  ORF type:complete len:173 (-),score=9.00 TRINITY_DN24777_c0_g1_i7:23-541(-)